MNKHDKIVVDARMINMSGIGRYIQAMIPALIKNFQKVTLMGSMVEISKFEWADKVIVIEVNAPIYSLSEQAEIIWKTPKCDIFISPHYNVPILLPQAKKVAVIIPDTNHLVFAKELSFVKRMYAKIFYQFAVNKDIIFTISDFSKSEIVKFTKCKPQKIIIAKCAIDKDHFRKLDKELSTNKTSPEIENYKNDNYVLFTGNVKPHKNLTRALLAFEEVAKNQTNLKFLIVGKRDNFITGDNKIFKLVEESPFLIERVKFTGRISDLNLAFLYKHAKAFLFPSLYEGFGLPPLEAMIFGCPVIASREGSLPEVCGDAAYYCDAYDVEDISRAIVQVLSNEALKKDLITKGFLKVEEYDWAIFNNSILNGLSQ
jgi:glycosyltransferase involved in cell wall biosynthesis